MFNSLPPLPTEDDLPYTDDQPVDNELQLVLPLLLRTILTLAWKTRNDWFMGINLGVYHSPGEPAIGPDAFLSLGTPRFRSSGKLRLSYVIWEENNVTPQWVLEIVSKKPGGEYDDKFQIYRKMGVLYYTIYNPDHWRRDRHDPFEVYRLVKGRYIRQSGQPIWMPELGLGIGIDRDSHEGGAPRHWLYWYDEKGDRLPIPEAVMASADAQITQERQRAEQERQRAEQERQRAEQERQRAEQERQRAEQERQERQQAEQELQALRAQLSARGIDPDDLLGDR